MVELSRNSGLVIFGHYVMEIVPMLAYGGDSVICYEKTKGKYGFEQVTSKHIETILKEPEYLAIKPVVMRVLNIAQAHGIYCPEIIRLPNNGLRVKWTEDNRYMNAIFKTSREIDINIGISKECYSQDFCIEPEYHLIDQTIIETAMFLLEGVRI